MGCCELFQLQFHNDGSTRCFYLNWGFDDWLIILEDNGTYSRCQRTTVLLEEPERMSAAPPAAFNSLIKKTWRPFWKSVFFYSNICF